MKSFARLVSILLLLALVVAGWWTSGQPLPGWLPGVLASLGVGGGPAKPPGPGGPGGGGPGGPGGPPGAMPPMPVETAAVRVGSLTRRVTAVGSLLSSESVMIRPESAGRIMDIAFTEGQPVAKGQVLVRMDDAVQKAQLAETQASLALSRAEAVRAEELFRQGSGAARTRDQAQAKLLFDQAEVVVSQTRLAKLVLVAPFDGILGLRKVSVGDYVKEGQDLVNLEAIDPLKLDFRIPEQFLPVVRVGQTLELSVDAFPNRRFQGEVFAIDPLIDVNGRSLGLRAKVDNKERILRPGLFARATLAINVAVDALLVPEQALFATGSEQFVYRVVEGKAKLTRVRLGERRGAEVELLEGVGRDDVVITAGHTKIRDGSAVMPMGAAAAAPPPGAGPKG